MKRAVLNFAVVVCAAAMLAGCAGAPVGWRLAYEHDAQGRPIAGSKAFLMASVEAGQPVMISMTGTGAGEGPVDAKNLLIEPGDRVAAEVPLLLKLNRTGSVDARAVLTTAGVIDTGSAQTAEDERVAAKWFVPVLDLTARRAPGAAGWRQRKTGRFVP